MSNNNPYEASVVEQSQSKSKVWVAALVFLAGLVVAFGTMMLWMANRAKMAETRAVELQKEAMQAAEQVQRLQQQIDTTPDSAPVISPDTVTGD